MRNTDVIANIAQEKAAIIEQIKKALNQESVMLETEVKNIEFI